MTREETKILFLDKFNFKSEEQIGAVMDIIDKIFDDFENKICKNCKHIKTTYAPICDLGVVSQGLFGNGIVTLDFGCNKFEAKDK